MCNYQSLVSSLCWCKHWETSTLACPCFSLAEVGLSSGIHLIALATGDQCGALCICMHMFLMSASQTCSWHPMDSSSSILGKRRSNGRKSLSSIGIAVKGSLVLQEHKGRKARSGLQSSLLLPPNLISSPTVHDTSLHLLFSSHLLGSLTKVPKWCQNCLCSLPMV